MKKNDREEDRKGYRLAFISVMLAAVLLALAGILYLQSKKQAQIAEEEVEVSTEEKERYEDYTVVRYEGETYKYNTDIKNILFLGIDQKDSNGIGRSDTMILMMMNTKEETVTMLSISRDTMTEVDVVNENGETVFSGINHLTLQYSYGDGGVKSCQLSKNAVSNLLYGVPIHYYVSMDLDGLHSVVNALGGVEVTLEEDYTYIDESLVAGEPLVLDGDLTERFVRYRDITEVGSSEKRLKRQEVFLQAFVGQLKERVGTDTTELQSMWGLVSPFLLTDVDVDTVERLATYELVDTTYQIPGEVVEGEQHDEFIVDDKNLQKIVINLLYKLK